MSYYVKPILENEKMFYCVYRKREEEKYDEFILYCVSEKVANRIALLLTHDEFLENLWENVYKD